MTQENVYWVEGSVKGRKGYRACCTKDAFDALAKLGFETKRGDVVYAVDDCYREIIYINHIVMVDEILHHDPDQLMRCVYDLAA